MKRIVLVVLVLWIAGGLVVWLTGALEEPLEPDPNAASQPENASDGDPPEALESWSAPSKRAPALERRAGTESAAALLERLGRPDTAAQRAEITAWVRAHPGRVGELMAAFLNGRVHYYDEDLVAFYRDVFGPLKDLEELLTPGLIASLDLHIPRNVFRNQPGLLALDALAPLSASTRRALEAWARANEDSRWLTGAVELVTESAESGDELVPLVQWLLTPDKAGAYRVYVPGLMRSLSRLGDRSGGLGAGIAEHAMSRAYAGRPVVKAMIDLGADDPAVQRALAAIIGGSGDGRGVASEFFEKREDGRELLLALLRDESPRVRLGAVLVLMANHWAEQEVLLPPILTCLPAKEALWRDRAMRLVPQLASSAEEAVPTLEAMFRSHEEQQWVTAAKTLHLLAAAYDGRFDVTQALEDALRHDNVRVRRVVVQSLMNYGAEAAVPMLRTALEDEDALVRERACDGLGELAQENAAALAALREAAQHDDERVVEMAQAWLEEIEDQAGKK